MSDKRNKLREKIFSSSAKQTEIIDFMGEQVELHQPTIGEIADLEQKSRDETRRETISSSLIQYCFVPGTNERVFKMEDKELIINLPATVLTEFNKAFAKLTNVDLEEVEKNLENL